MDAARWSRIQELFDRAMEVPEEKRSALLEAEADAELRREVLELLEQVDSPSLGAKIEDAAAQAAASLLEQHDEKAEDELVGTEVDGYRIVAKIGAGGFGAVYRAEQSKPVRRTVALKIARGSLGEEGRRRFELESQLLAHVEHPNIAKVYDAGWLGDRPYFVMEHLDGQDIASYCRSNALSLERRLRLYLDVCAGVAHAHQRGIIHRDLKPSNSLVVERTAAEEAELQVKVIDFGIAKVTPLTETDSLGGRPDLTEHVQVVGTLEYMSPEQASLESQNLDTRSDVYCLGAMLYELLTETPPFSRRELTGSGYEQALRTVREKDPPRPSARLLSEGKDAAQAGALRGDLDQITMKALAKEPERRYQTVRELMDDVRRFLRNEPVEARAPSLTYVAGKFVRRHRVPVAAALAILLALAAGLVAAALGFQQAARERDRALAASTRAEQAAAEANQVSDFLIELFRASDPEIAQGEELTARELLDAGARRADRLQEPVATRLRSVVGDVYLDLGLLDDAEPLLEQALQQRRQLAQGSEASTDRRALVQSLHSLSRLALDRGDLEAAMRAVEESVELSRQLDEGALIADSLDHMFDIHYWHGNGDGMEAAVEESLELRQAALLEVDASDTERSTAARIALADTQLKETEYWAFRRDFHRALESAENGVENYEAMLDPLHPKLLHGKQRHAWLLANTRDAERAPAAALDVLDRLIAVYGEEHTAVAGGYASLGSAYYRASLEHDKALAAFDRALQIYRNRVGDDHRLATAMKRHRAFALAGLERYEEAVRAHREILEHYQATLPADHREISFEHFNLGTALLHNRDYEEAAQHFYRHLDFRPQDNWWDAYQAARPMNFYARALAGAGNYQEAVRVLQRAVELVGAHYSKEHSLYRMHTSTLAEVYGDWGQNEEAERWFAETEDSEAREKALAAEAASEG